MIFQEAGLLLWRTGTTNIGYIRIKYLVRSFRQMGRKAIIASASRVEDVELDTHCTSGPTRFSVEPVQDMTLPAGRRP